MEGRETAQQAQRQDWAQHREHHYAAPAKRPTKVYRRMVIREPSTSRGGAPAQQAQRQHRAQRQEHHHAAPAVAHQELRRVGRQLAHGARAHVCQQCKVADDGAVQQQQQRHLRHDLRPTPRDSACSCPVRAPHMAAPAGGAAPVS